MSNPTKVVFTLPSTNTDGTALALSDITGVKVSISASGSTDPGVTATVSGPFTSTDQSYLLPTLPPGNYSVVLQTESTSLGTAVISAPSSPVTFTIASPSIPNPPSAVSVV